jgi:ribosomal protein S12 methylthiotransferase accessory factor
MGLSVPGRIGQFASGKLTSILIIGIRLEDSLARLLKKAFPAARFLADLSALDGQTAELAIGIFEHGDHHRQTGFAKWANLANVPALSVQLDQFEALIGPLALPGRAGCGRCALERMAAAGNFSFGTAPIRLSPEVTHVAIPALIREIRKIIRQRQDHFDLVDHVLAIDTRTLDAALHRVIPLSHCIICGGAAAYPGPIKRPVRLFTRDSPEVVLAALEGWVDQRTGVISGVILEPPAGGAAALPFIATAAPPHIMEEDSSLRRLPLGWGKGLTISGAVLSAVGEAIERYAASLPEAGRIVWERPEDLEGEFLDPRDLALYTDAQYARADFPYCRFDPSIRHPWIRGKWLGSELSVWIPAVFAFLSLTLAPEQLICQGSSNGLAASTDPQEAALRATLELVERDAFMAAWLSARPGRRIELDETLDPLLRQVLDGIEARGATVEMYALPTSACGITILCLGLGDGIEYPGATIGLGADLDARLALQQALLELAQTGPYLQNMMHTKQLPVPDRPSSVQNMLQHAAYFFPHDRAKAFDRLRTIGARLVLSELGKETPRRSLADCASELKAKGVRVALVDVTSADVLTGPFHVFRAVSPDLQPIWYGFGLERQLVARIRNMGLTSEIPAIHPIW